MTFRGISLTMLLIMSTHQTASYNILGLFPHPGASHFHFFHPVMKTLAEAGHDVTVVSFFPDASSPKNYHDLPLTGVDLLTNSVDLSWFEKRKSFGHFIEFFMLNNWGQEACANALNSSAIEKVLKSKKHFDVVIVEQFNSDCMMGIAWKLQAPVIGLSSCALMPWHNDRIGNPSIPSYIPALFMGYTDDMTFGQRIANWITVHGMKLLYKHIVDPAIDKLVRARLGDNVPSVTELSKTTSLILVNQHYSLSGAKPVSPSLIEIGGIHIQEPKPLEDELLHFLDSAEHGVIYVSWGSMIRAETLPIEKREALLKAFGLMKQSFLWKWENDTLPNQPNNVFIKKWMPQREILCHPNVKVFVTHGGLLGSSEAAYCGVPVVVTPMYGDQFLNAAALVSRGMGSIVPYEEITKTSIESALIFALDPKTQSNAKKVSFSFRNRIQTPKELTVWWVEHVAATEGAPLTRSHSTLLPGYVYYSLDIYTTFLIVFFIFVGSWVWVICKFFRTSHVVPTKVKSN